MSTPKPNTQKAKIGGVEHEFAWGRLAQIRFSGIEPARRTDFGTMGLAQIAWCAIASIRNPFPSFEHLAAVVEDSEWSGMDAACAALFPKAEDEPPESAEAEKKS